MTTRIIVADDHPMVQAALRTALTKVLPDTELVACHTLEAVLQMIALDPAGIDLVLLDLSMPDAQGFSGLFLLQAQYPTIPVAIISAQDSTSTIHRAIAYGASGFLPKSLDLSVMLHAVAAILAGDVWTPPEAGVVDKAAPDDADMASRLASLSAQQMRILMMIVDGKLNKQIAASLSIAEQTVKIHTSTIFRKLGVRNRTQAAVFIQKIHAGA